MSQRGSRGSRRTRGRSGRRDDAPSDRAAPSARAAPGGDVEPVRFDAASTWIAIALLALAVALWASNWVIGRMIRLDAPAAGLTFARWAIAALVLLAFNIRQVISHWPLLRRSWPILLLLASTASVLQHLPVYVGLRTTTATTGALLNATTPVFIVLLVWLILGERMRGAVVAGICLSMMGAIWIVTRGHPEALVQWVLEVGDLWILFGAVSWAVYTICLRWRPAGLPAMTFLTALSVLGALLALPLAAIEYAFGARFLWSAPVLASVLYIGLGPTVLGYIFWNRGVEVLGPGRAGPFMYLMPVYTPLMGWLILDERMASFHVVGIALIFAGIALTRWRPATVRARI